MTNGINSDEAILGQQDSASTRTRRHTHTQTTTQWIFFCGRPLGKLLAGWPAHRAKKVCRVSGVGSREHSLLSMSQASHIALQAPGKEAKGKMRPMDRAF